MTQLLVPPTLWHWRQCASLLRAGYAGLVTAGRSTLFALGLALYGCASPPAPPARPAPSPPCEERPGVFTVALDASSVVVPRDLRDLEPLRDRPALQQIDLSRSVVPSLEPVSNLPLLRTVIARGSNLFDLPDGGFLFLQTLDLRDTRIPRASVERFQRAHPGCRISYVAQGEALLARVHGADRLQVLDDESKPYLALEGERFQELLRLLAAALDAGTERPPGITCGCMANCTLVFKRGGEVVHSVPWVHDGYLELSDWNGQFKLRDPYRRQLAAMLGQLLPN